VRRLAAPLSIVVTSAALAAGPPAQAAQPQHITVRSGNLALPALLAKPKRRHSPAVVLLHGCSGLWSTADSRLPVDQRRPQRHIRRWLTTLQSAGFTALAVDSFTPRGITRVCGQPPERTGISEVTDRVRDAFAALAYLRARRGVRDKRIAVMGWSNGGSTTLAALGRNAPVRPPRTGGFRMGIAFYPGCGLRGAFRSYVPTKPLYLFHASEDPLAPPCRARSRHAGPRFHIKVFRAAHHSFDEAPGPGFTRADLAARRAADRAALRAIRRNLV